MAAATCGPSGYLQTDVTKRSISDGEMYSTICGEWAGDHFGFSLT